MKKSFLLVISTLILAACADTRSHIHPDATSWEKVEYQVDKATEKTQ